MSRRNVSYAARAASVSPRLFAASSLAASSARRIRCRRSDTSIARPIVHNVPMLPSQTVENYLKTIFLAQVANGSSDALVPMGQIATTLGVVPGTATTMIKTLAESGLVHYEPELRVR